MAVVLVVNDDADMLKLYHESLLISMGHQPVTKMVVARRTETVRDVGADALVVDLSSRENEYGVRIIREVRADPANQRRAVMCAPPLLKTFSR